MSGVAVQPGRGRRPLWLLALLFFAPFLLAIWLYFVMGWRPLGHTNHGMLIEPARPLPAVSLLRADGTAAAAGVLRGKWTLLYIGAGSCDADCHATLYYTRQTRLGLGQAASRVQRVFLATGSGCCDRAFLQREHPDLITLAAGAAAAPLLAQFPPDRAHTIFIIDPLGNLMMRYDAKADPKGLREDMKKLLNLSQIG